MSHDDLLKPEEKLEIEKRQKIKEFNDEYLLLVKKHKLAFVAVLESTQQSLNSKLQVMEVNVEEEKEEKKEKVVVEEKKK